MLIGSKYSDDKMYRGIKFYDKLPLLSEDMHEYSDTAFMKNAYIMNNIIGYGVLNSPKLVVDSIGVRLQEPAVILIDGDISLVYIGLTQYFADIDRLSEAGYQDGVICIVGYYQHVDSKTDIQAYGCLETTEGLYNDLADNEFGVQVSTRYQFRWSIVLLDKNSLKSEDLVISIDDRDETGRLLGTKSILDIIGRVDDVLVADVPDSMKDYALSNLYVVPLIEYTYNESDSTFTAKGRLPIKPKGSSGFINSETEPVGEYLEGTTWYNPITREFKVYVTGTGFVSSASTMGFLQYQSSYTMPQSYTTSQNIVVKIGIDELQEGDILQVSYEGLLLVPGEHYSIDYANNSITLLGFTAELGDKIGFVATKIVEANDITSITATFTTHMASTGSGTVEAHVKLSDTVDSRLDQGKGVAATPKSVYESTLIKDTEKNINYKFGVANGLLYLEEV